ncbi:hypothetical protein HanPI659440_Chr07g0271441 [Helianthus annuus]|nr:hypothetical protein HanPI659440_Chr07g0271441 [Helianthus annuus]
MAMVMTDKGCLTMVTVVLGLWSNWSNLVHTLKASPPRSTTQQTWSTSVSKSKLICNFFHCIFSTEPVRSQIGVGTVFKTKSIMFVNTRSIIGVKCALFMLFMTPSSRYIFVFKVNEVEEFRTSKVS